jgi:dihydroxy-acid dehydratase
MNHPPTSCHYGRGDAKGVIIMAMARINVPAIFVYGGTIKPGHYKGKDLTIVSAFEAVGEFNAGRLSATDFKEIERRACPGSGSCGGMYTANTMSSAIEAMGMSLPCSSTMANEDAEKGESAAESARARKRSSTKSNRVTSSPASQSRMPWPW